MYLGLVHLIMVADETIKLGCKDYSRKIASEEDAGRLAKLEY